MKLVEKKRINSKYYKKYDFSRTPYDRVMASGSVSEKTRVTFYHESTRIWNESQI